MNDYERYVDHIYSKYRDMMGPYERECVFHRCGLESIDHLMTDDEKSTLMRLWNEEYGWE